MIVNAVCGYLEAKKYFFWRSNNVPVFDTVSKSMRRMPKYSKKGVPDITVVHKGQFIGIEVKRPTGIMSREQADFSIGCIKHGGQYWVVTSIDDIAKIL